jgi:N,N'-diacetyllegionaminate synthase
MYCNNAYPTPLEDAGVGIVKQLSYDTRYKWGLSDHTLSPIVPALAVSAGASVIEKHFTINKKLSGPDHCFALEPNELEEMIRYIKIAEKAIQKQTSDKISDSEKKFMNAMRSVVTKKRIKKGEVFTMQNLTTKRPFFDGNIPARKLLNILGKKSSNDYNTESFVRDVEI